MVWVKGLLNELNIIHKEFVTLLCDNKVSLQIVSNPMFHDRIKHIEIDYHFVSEKLQDELINLKHVTSKEQLANIFTK